MTDKIIKLYDGDINPAEVLAELTELLKAYNPEIHTGQDAGCDYLGDDEFRMILKNQTGNELLIDLTDEFTVAYDYWHGHYFDYGGVKRCVFQLLNNERCVFIVFIEDRWMGSGTSVKPFATKAEVKEEMRDFLDRDELAQEAREKGVEARIVYWDESKNRTIRFAPGEY